MATLAYLSLLLVLLLLLPLYIIYMPPRLVIRYCQRRWPDVLWQVRVGPTAPAPRDVVATDKVIALTIDDAPSQYTHEILQLLAEHGAHATLFVIGAQVLGREDVLADAVTAGHELGNHGMHDEPARALDLDVLEDQIMRVRGLIADASPLPQHLYFRPGSGLFSSTMRARVARLGYRVVLGGVYPHDAQISCPRLNAWHILGMAHIGAIIVCHDRRSWTAPMLRKVLPELTKRGYRIVNITELLEAAGQ
ncbi:glycoside hydrolase/deacetylase [Auricularia subglabra TFB-10046 SS5]|uniref:chitin deacetylase n=1 Tax=Auricularia subglabra (strain TFB-10046 / SS5) TaxID=717982 RepID=J0WVU5_AURST|nr:glycoside hydrolase/deacetylase [Auricularia subglabra TFB-10046 SS5]